MNVRKSSATLAVPVLVLLFQAAAVVRADEQLEFVRSKVRPLLESRCFECHGPGMEAKGGLSMGSRAGMLEGGDSGPLFQAGKPEDSLLISAVKYESFEMPPRSRIPDEEIAILEKWIAMGAPWEDDASHPSGAVEKAAFPLLERKASHWAWHPIQNSPVPDAGGSDWPISESDRFILKSLSDAGLAPAPDADRRVILRRLCFDLVGLPPSKELADRFLNDPQETTAAMTTVVDELLASPQFGERWGRHWLDLVRYAETLGHEFDFPLPYAWRYRDYVIRAFNEDVPYNQFVREHVAGDLLVTPRRHREDLYNESIIATGFWYLSEDKHAPVDVRGEEAARMDNQIDVFGKSFLGLTIGCARCHDHKFDAITSADYYALAGYLQSSRRRVEWLDPVRRTESMARLLAFLRKETREPIAHGIIAMPPQRVIDRMKELLYSKLPVTDPELTSKVLLAEKTREFDHPLSLVAKMKAARDSARAAAAAEGDPSQSKYDWKATVSEWCQGIREAQNAPGLVSTERFARVEGEVPADWNYYGLAFHWIENSAYANEPAHRPGVILPAYTFDVSWTSEGPRALPRDRVSSLTMGPQFKGVLATPTFELKDPEIAVLVAGEKARMRLVIDGYVMNEFSELLFSGARQPIDTLGEYRWIRLGGDVHRYIGHRCHLEFMDDGEGWFSVKEIRFVKHAGGADPPLHAPSDINLKLATTLMTMPPATEEDVLAQVSIAAMQDVRYITTLTELGVEYSGYTHALEKAAQQWPEIIANPPETFPVLVMCDGSGEDEHLLIRGNHKNPGAPVKRRLLEAIDGPEGMMIERGSGRLQLADRLIAEDNPLVARVMVNRIWQHLFGKGIVASPDNFGVLGQKPSHPELLDYLATKFRRDGWSVKSMIRELVLSRTYRMSSLPDPRAEASDPSNRLLHHANVRRLEGEAIRDSILSLSGKMNLTMYGPPVPVYLSPFMQGRGRPGASGPLDGEGRRSIYQSVNRNFLSPFMITFDTPVPAAAVGLRSQSNVPAQALILLNSEFVQQQATVWAEKLVAEQPESLDMVLERIYFAAFSRLPTAEERKLLADYVQNEAGSVADASVPPWRNSALVADLCHVVFNQKEFLFLE